MIIDLERFVAVEEPYWKELAKLLDRLEAEPDQTMGLGEVQRFHYLYRRTSGCLARLSSFASEPELRKHVESLVARSYAEIHETRDRTIRFHFVRWFLRDFPTTFRKHLRAFALSVAVTMVGCLFGGAVLAFDPESKPVVMPFPHLLQDPRQRVAEEEAATVDRLSGHRGTFSADLMTHNTKVSILTFGLGMSWGVGTIVMLFYNGVILGAVAFDYLAAGEGRFLLGWLLPHGSVEIPAILLAGQAGLILAGAVIGYQSRLPLRGRLRMVTGDVVTLMGGVAVLLVWAGLVESFLSQYHEPVLPYELKIALGLCELIALVLFLGRAGSRRGLASNDSRPSAV